MGTWHGPTIEASLNLVLDKVDPHLMLRSRAEFIDALASSGLIVPAGYYVPDARELLDLMHRWQYHLRAGMQGCRWVMCRETVDALAKQYERKVVPVPQRLDIDFWPNTDLPSAALQMEVETIIESKRYWASQDRLFGVPIRIDPAARSPMFEIDTQATSRT